MGKVDFERDNAIEKCIIVYTKYGVVKILNSILAMLLSYQFLYLAKLHPYHLYSKNKVLTSYKLNLS